jgi:hypothetical protein
MGGTITMCIHVFMCMCIVCGRIEAYMRLNLLLGSIVFRFLCQKIKEMKKKKIVQEVEEKEKVFPEFNNEKYEK